MVVINQINNFKIGNSMFLGTIDQLNYIALVTPGIASANKALVVDGNRDITNINSLSANNINVNTINVTTISATNIDGTLSTPAQPNITSVGTLTSLTVNGPTSLTGNNSLSGTNIIDGTNTISGSTTSSGIFNLGDNVNLTGTTNNTGIFQINGITLSATAAELNSVSGITPGIASASKFILLDSNKSISGITSLSTSIINLNSQTIGGSAISSTSWLTNGIISKSIATACTINPSSGTITSAVYTSYAINVLNGSASTTVTNCANLYIAGPTTAGTNITITNNYALWIASGKILFADTTASTSTSTGSLVINGGVGIGGTLYANSINGTSGSFNSLTLGGTLLTTTISQINTIFTSLNTGTVTAAHGVFGDLTYGGTLLTVTAAQLNNLFTNFTSTNVNTTNLTIGGTLLTINIPLLNNIFTSFSTTNGSITNLTYGGTLITATAAQINSLSGIVAGTLTANKFVMVDANKRINEFFVANTLTTTGLITTTATINSLTLGAVLLTVTAAQLNSIFTNLVTTAITVTNLTIGSTLLTVTAAQLNNIFTSFTTTTLAATNTSITALTLGGTLVTATAAQINVLAGTIAGTLVANKFVMVDSSKNINEFRIHGDLYVGDLVSTNGMIKINNIANQIYLHVGQNTATTSSDLCITNIDQDINTSTKKIIFKADGTIGFGTATPGKQLEVSNSNGDCLRLTNSGLISYSTDLLVSSSGDLTINTSRSVRIGTTVSANLPLEVGKITYTLLSAYGYLRSNGSIGSSLSSLLTDFSIRADGRIISKSEINVTSDRRVKNEIVDLDNDFCKKFITNTNPVSFKFTNSSETKTHYGYIAQDIVKAGFEQLVGIVSDKTLSETIDDDGFISPAGHQLILCYDEIIPILAKNIKMLYEKVESQDKIILELAKLLKNNFT
jgi:Chaperone of endosialidase